MEKVLTVITNIYIYSAALAFLVLLPGTLKNIRCSNGYKDIVECIKYHLFLAFVPIGNIYIGLAVIWEWIDGLGQRNKTK